jgi:hypothetical protein
MTNAILEAAEKTFHAAGVKPKDVAAILNKLESEFDVTASVSGGLLKLEQTGTTLDVGASLATYKAKHPRDFYGEAGDISFKSDLAGDDAAKVRFIRENGAAAWEQLPYNEKSLPARHVVTDQIPSSLMTAEQYKRLSVQEKVKLVDELGTIGIEKILARKGKK